MNMPTLQHSILLGSFGFALVSLAVFATVAFAEKWMYQHLGLKGAYVTWTALFIFLGGAVLGALVVGRWRLPRFLILFGIAFFAYAFGWTAAYFSLRGTTGEWLGSAAGSILMAMVLALGFGVIRLTGLLAAILFLSNSAGYFVGSAVHNMFGGSVGMLLWGVLYGLFLGAGLGAVIYLAQTKASVASLK